MAAPSQSIAAPSQFSDEQLFARCAELVAKANFPGTTKRQATSNRELAEIIVARPHLLSYGTEGTGVTLIMHAARLSNTDAAPLDSLDVLRTGQDIRDNDGDVRPEVYASPGNVKPASEEIQDAWRRAVNLQDGKGRTALHHAFEMPDKNHAATVALHLVQKGLLNPNTRCDGEGGQPGKTAIEDAEARGVFVDPTWGAAARRQLDEAARIHAEMWSKWTPPAAAGDGPQPGPNLQFQPARAQEMKRVAPPTWDHKMQVKKAPAQAAREDEATKSIRVMLTASGFNDAKIDETLAASHGDMNVAAEKLLSADAMPREARAGRTVRLSS